MGKWLWDLVWMGVFLAVVLSAPMGLGHEDPENVSVDGDTEASTLVLNLTDMQTSGWRETGDEELDSEAEGFQDGHRRQFVKAEGSYRYRTIETGSYVFNSTWNATQYYHDQKSSTEEDWSTQERSWGDEAYYWETFSSNSRSYIREDHIVWGVERNRQGHYDWEPSWDWLATTLVSKYTPPNVHPTANFELSNTGLKVKADGTWSTDSDGSISAYRWEWGDNKGTRGEVSTHTYAVAGTYTITLQVTDDRGGTDTTSRTITVQNLAPSSHFYFEPRSPDVGEVVTFEDQSEDPDTRVVERVWNFGDGNSSASPSPTHAFEDPGTYSVRLSVEDSMGAQDTSEQTVEVTVRGEEETRGTPMVAVSTIQLLLASVALVFRWPSCRG